MPPNKWKWIVAPTTLAVMLVTGTALAALSLSYTNPSQQTLGVTQPPVVFVKGADANDSKYVSGWSLSSNLTYFSVTVNGVPEATVTIGDLFKIRNNETNAHTVTLTSDQVTHMDVITYEVVVYNPSSTEVGRLNLTAPSPSLSFSAAGSTDYRAEVVIRLASGAGSSVGQTSSINMAVDW